MVHFEALSDTLQETVGAAITEGVRAALLEIVSNQDILAVLRNSLPTPAPLAVPVHPEAPKASIVRAIVSKACSAVNKAVKWSWNGLKAGAGLVANGARTALNQLTALGQRLRAMRHARRPLLVALGVGVLAAGIALVAPSWVAAIVSGLGGAGATLAVQAGLWLRQNLSRLLVQST